MPYTDAELAVAAHMFEQKLDQLERGEINPEVEDISDLRAIADAALAVEVAEATLRERVQISRAHGRSWTDIARPMNVSRQAARQRFGTAATATTTTARKTKRITGARVPKIAGRRQG